MQDQYKLYNQQGCASVRNNTSFTDRLNSGKQTTHLSDKCSLNKNDKTHFHKKYFAESAIQTYSSADRKPDIEDANVITGNKHNSY